jgi:hypothetical protein
MPNFVETSDERLQSHLLRKNMLKREEFDPTNRRHCESYKSFLTTGNWGPARFYCEFPYVTVPETVSRKFALETLNKIL